MSTEEQNQGEQQPATSASNQMIEQINIALEQKGVREFLVPGSLKPAVGD